MSTIGTFPFGSPLRPVVQLDRGPKDVFVLGVYSSAIHAEWRNPGGGVRVRALAVANEPYPFWDGDDLWGVFHAIDFAEGDGYLVPADLMYNGPSGRALDDNILSPLGFIDRSRVWYADLVPHFCLNKGQADAIRKEYAPRASEFGWPKANIPTLPKELTDHARRIQLVLELAESQARLLVLLGDQPIKWFLRAFDDRWGRLAAFGTDVCSYGRLHEVQIADGQYLVLPVVHPRQAARLGRYSERWYELHAEWMRSTVNEVGEELIRLGVHRGPR